MARFWPMFDTFINWLEHGYFLFQLGAAIGLGTLLQAIIATHTKIPSPYVSAIWWLASAAFMGLLVWLGHIVKKRKPAVIQTRTSPPAGGMQFEQLEAFYQAYDSQLLREVEDATRHEAQRRQSVIERETFLIRSLAAVIIMAFFDATWYAIFGSQIRALERLNKSVAKVEDLRLYFEQDLDKRPQYPFESWFGYLKEQVLIRQDGYNISITVRGKEFLKYLVQYGRTSGDKIG